MWIVPHKAAVVPIALLLIASAELTSAQLAPTTAQIASFREDLLASFVIDNGGVGTSGGGTHHCLHAWPTAQSICAQHALLPLLLGSQKP